MEGVCRAGASMPGRGSSAASVAAAGLATVRLALEASARIGCSEAPAGLTSAARRGAEGANTGAAVRGEEAGGGATTGSSQAAYSDSATNSSQYGAMSQVFITSSAPG